MAACLTIEEDYLPLKELLTRISWEEMVVLTHCSTNYSFETTRDNIEFIGKAGDVPFKYSEPYNVSKCWVKSMEYEGQTIPCLIISII
jgi:hypothetical protein